MRNLRTRNPSAYQYLVDGGFSGSLSGEKHTKIPMDQIIEMTINRCSKETGGLSGKTENAGASARWVRINHYLAALKQHLDNKVKMNTHSKHVELGSRRMKKDETAVERITVGLHTWVPDLWSPSQPLINISTGVVATGEMADNVVTTKERGDKASKEFIQRITDPQQATTHNMSDSIETGETPCITRSTTGYHDPIKRQPVFTFDKLTEGKTKMSIVEDEGRSFATILAEYDARKLNLRPIMNWPITSKPWAICSELGQGRISAKSLFRNNLQNLSPEPPSTTVPSEIECSVVDAMRVVRLIPITGLVPNTFRSWANRVVVYLRTLPGSTIHLVFDDYRPADGNLYLSKGRPDRGRERHITDLGQRLPKLQDWNDFLTNDSNKMQLTHLLADFILSGESMIGEDIYVTKGNHCMYVAGDGSQSAVDVPELCSQHKEADPRLAHHAVYASTSNAGVCVVADDTDVYILLLFVSCKCDSSLYFRQGTATSKCGITYHNVKSLAEHLGGDICKRLPAFHVLTGCDFTQPFYGRSKYRSFRKMQQNPNTLSLLSSLETTEADINEVIDFVLHVIYNRPKKEKTPGDSRYAMLFSGKGSKRSFTPLKRLPPDRLSLKYAIRRANLVTNGMVNCLNSTYHQLEVLSYGWELENGIPVPIWYDGNALPHNDELDDMPSVEHTQLPLTETTAAVTPENIRDGLQFDADASDSDEDCVAPESEESSDSDT